MADGAIFGNATTEAGEGALGQLQTRVFGANGAWLLSGDKFYSTGTLYAHWVGVTVQRDDTDPAQWRTLALVRTNAPGVERVDDWNGFGQRLTPSGTTLFDRVPVEAAHIVDFSRTGAMPMTAVFPLFHIATLAGIARAIERDAVAFVQPRKRVFSHGSGAVPRDHPLVQQVIGQLSSTAFVATLAAREVARGLGEIDRLRPQGEPLSDELLVDVELPAGKAQVVVTDAVLGAATRLFDAGLAQPRDLQGAGDRRQSAERHPADLLLGCGHARAGVNLSVWAGSAGSTMNSWRSALLDFFLEQHVVDARGRRLELGTASRVAVLTSMSESCTSLSQHHHGLVHLGDHGVDRIDPQRRYSEVTHEMG
ncbi:acyl-CoA dehydrogenase family protein [Variovorax sp. N23]|uniref:acyl-CoA dehydrogenase family protein n=1 Tax=Variovorax sp. N23 TaxID=2980555 RepID=UPI0021C76E3C|nr:acyl-CoA dehydrogenase family protein [Variovorax sp. N23]MCU4120045.1 hypothetical protein [Variovorax sp. N23]